MGNCGSVPPEEVIPPYTDLKFEIVEKFMDLKAKDGEIQAEYVWLGSDMEMRCKTRTLKAGSSL